MAYIISILVGLLVSLTLGLLVQVALHMATQVSRGKGLCVRTQGTCVLARAEHSAHNLFMVRRRWAKRVWRRRVRRHMRTHTRRTMRTCKHARRHGTYATMRACYRVRHVAYHKAKAHTRAHALHMRTMRAQERAALREANHNRWLTNQLVKELVRSGARGYRTCPGTRTTKAKRTNVVCMAEHKKSRRVKALRARVHNAAQERAARMRVQARMRALRKDERKALAAHLGDAQYMLGMAKVRLALDHGLGGCGSETRELLWGLVSPEERYEAGRKVDQKLRRQLKEAA